MSRVVVSISVLAIGGLVACDPKVGDAGDEDAELDSDSADADADEDGDEDGQTSAGSGATTVADSGDEPGTTSVGTTPDEPDCEDVGECPEPPPAVQHAYAIRFGDLPPVDVGETDTGGSGGEEIDPDTLLVVIGNGADSCDDPWAANACGEWRVSFSLPPGTEPGVYSLFPELNGGTSATGPADENGECWFGGGSLEGTLELTSTDGAIVGRITDAESFDFDANVEFTATLCP